MLYPVKLYFKHLPNIIMISLSLAMNIFMWVWLLIRIKATSEPIFLHYNILFGVDYIGEWWRVLYYPFFGLMILVVNMVIGWWFFGKNKFIAQLLNFFTLLCQVILLIGAGFLIYLNV